MKTPKYLTAGDTIGIVAPARKVSEKELSAAVKVFRSWGLQIALGKNLFGSSDQFSGTDTGRAADLQYMFDHPEIRAIICARGGYGTVRVVDMLDFSQFKKNPKWIAGFSDITVLHAHINERIGVETIHSMMPLNITGGKKMLPRALALETSRKALFGERISYHVLAHPLNRNGSASGIIVGGNLSVLYSLSGSVSDINAKEKILFIEDLDEYLYHIDRMMVNLDRAGKLSEINALIVGGMTEMRDNKIPFGKTAEEIISDIVKKYSFPVCFGFPAGHIDDNRALILGRTVSLDVRPSGVTLEFQQ